MEPQQQNNPSESNTDAIASESNPDMTEKNAPLSQMSSTESPGQVPTATPTGAGRPLGTEPAVLPPQSSASQTTYSASLGAQSPKNTSRKKLMLVGIVSVIVLLAGLGAATFVLFRDKDSSTNTNTVNTDSEKKKTEESETKSKDEYSAFVSTDERVKTADDAERVNSLKNLQQILETYFNDNDTYPSFTQLNDSNWRKQNNIVDFAVTEPISEDTRLATTPSKGQYAYLPTPSGCDNTSTKCTAFTLVAILDDGKEYEIESVNQ